MSIHIEYDDVGFGLRNYYLVEKDGDDYKELPILIEVANILQRSGIEVREGYTRGNSGYRADSFGETPENS